MPPETVPVKVAVAPVGVICPLVVVNTHEPLAPPVPPAPSAALTTTVDATGHWTALAFVASAPPAAVIMSPGDTPVPAAATVHAVTRLTLLMDCVGGAVRVMCCGST